MKKRIFAWLIFRLMVLASGVSFVTSLEAAILNVPVSYSTIQAAINAAVPGDTVLVADGIYTGSGNKNLDFNGKTITVKSENGSANCIIDCQNNGRGFYFHSGENRYSVVDGFTIRNGRIDYGGGICCRNSSSPTIRNCIIIGNSTYSGGGIFCNGYSSPIITHCIITGNSAPSYNPGGNGGGILCSFYSSPIITNCTISENLATKDGGGIYCNYYSSPIITNCTISRNSANYGGGIHCLNFCSPTIINSILWENIPNPIYNSAYYNLIITYSDIQGGYAGTGNINSDPLFVDSLDVNFHLTAASPCIDTGTPAGVPADDLDGILRPQGSGFDMGAYEFIDGDTDTNSDGISDSQDNCPMVPNPDQSDWDGDGFGDVCDNCISLSNAQEDADQDGIGNECDNCPELPNPKQSDWDGDGFGDLCDNCISLPNDQEDADQDGIGNECDNCPELSNPEQSDDDWDGLGNECDNCPDTYNPDQTDSNGNGIGDECDMIPGNLDGDGDVDLDDLVIIQSHLNQPADVCPECDIDGDGTITVLDVRKLVLLCTCPKCLCP